MSAKIQHYRDKYGYSLILLRQLVISDFKLRYQGSALGYLWSLLRPLALFLTLYVIFVKFIGLGAGIPDYPVYLLLGVVLWNFFTEVTNGSIGSIVGKGDLLRKINFPKYVIVLSGSFSALINLFLNLLVVFIFALFAKVDISTGIIFVPLLIAELFIFALGIGFFLSAAFVRFRDITFIWEVFMQGAFYATPILYPLSEKYIPLKYAKLLILNPVAQVIQDFRYVSISPITETINTLYGSHLFRLIPIGAVLFTAMIAAIYFRKRSKYFAEEV
ncbi:ABC transporter permease [Patescibacteria group bacterium]|jgi:ABC-2 type transport system permease protein|nr:ABC transporter permease [Patescibacteria group bacterium]